MLGQQLHWTARHWHDDLVVRANACPSQNETDPNVRDNAALLHLSGSLHGHCVPVAALGLGRARRCWPACPESGRRWPSREDRRALLGRRTPSVRQAPRDPAVKELRVTIRSRLRLDLPNNSNLRSRPSTSRSVHTNGLGFLQSLFLPMSAISLVLTCADGAACNDLEAGTFTDFARPPRHHRFSANAARER